MADLFSKQDWNPEEVRRKDPPKNLAARIRPNSLDQIFGQKHLLGKGKLLRRVIASDQYSALLFYGPPGTGKTTLARVLARESDSHFVFLNAVEATVGDVRSCLKEALAQWETHGRRTLLLLDEIHRFNKAQQDVLLPHLEEGRIRMVGATTQNPFFALTPALVSRMQIFEFKPLSKNEVKEVLRQAVNPDSNAFNEVSVEISSEALIYFSEVSQGDARRALSALEVAVETTKPRKSTITVTEKIAKASIQKSAVVYDATGDQHYDTLSAFIKSIRATEPDVAVYWLGKMLEGGEDIRIIARRLVISAAEDIGLADPQALVVAGACQSAVEKIGMPEARILLSQATLYLATAPKSNKAYEAISGVMEDIQNGRIHEVPDALKDTHYSSAKKLGRGKGYAYTHQYQEGVAPHEMIPDFKQYYFPTGRGYERVIKERLDKWREYRKGQKNQSPEATEGK